MSTSVDEFESKLGQFIYTHVIFERLRSFLLERVETLPSSTFKISLGTDPEGNEVVLNVTISKVRVGRGAPVEGVSQRKKTVVVTLVNEVPAESDVDFARELGRILQESLKWWQSYLRERDKLRLKDWRIEKTIAVECVNSRPVFTLPVDSVSMPRDLDEEPLKPYLDRLEPIIDLFGPIYVRPLGTSTFELVVGLPKLLCYKRAKRETIDAYVIDEGEDLDHIYKLEESFRNLLSLLNKLEVT